MQPLVHVALGALLGYVAGLAIDASPPRHRAAAVASALWGSVPDWHLALDAAGVDGLARSWRAYHDAPVANLHWFHHAIDARETTLYALEDAVALVVLVAVAVALSRRGLDRATRD